MWTMRTRFIATVVAAVIVATIGISSPAHAAVGGIVWRYNSIQNLVIAKTYSYTSNGQGGSCTVWNKTGDPVPQMHVRSNNCTTASMNGKTSSEFTFLDVDVFTMQYEGYWVNMTNNQWYWVSANVYTRFHTDQFVECYRPVAGEPVDCYVYDKL